MLYFLGIAAIILGITAPAAAQTDPEQMNRDICAGVQHAAYDLNKEYEGVSITTMGGRILSVYATADCERRWYIIGFRVDDQIVLFLDRIDGARRGVRSFMCSNAEKSRQFTEAGWQTRIKVTDPWGGVHQEIVGCR
jgi:hypothetical protein